MHRMAKDAQGCRSLGHFKVIAGPGIARSGVRESRGRAQVWSARWRVGPDDIVRTASLSCYKQLAPQRSDRYLYARITPNRKSY